MFAFAFDINGNVKRDEDEIRKTTAQIMVCDFNQ
jgi:hypothetical protein